MKETKFAKAKRLSKNRSKPWIPGIKSIVFIPMDRAENKYSVKPDDKLINNSDSIRNHFSWFRENIVHDRLNEWF